MPSLAFRKASICSRFSFSASCTLVVNPQHATCSRLILCWKLPPPSGSSCIGKDFAYTWAGAPLYNVFSCLHSPRSGSSPSGVWMKIFRGTIFLLLAAFILLAELGCGDQYRPVANPIIGPGGQPQSTHFAYVLNSNSNPNGDSSTTKIDVSGDTVSWVQTLGVGSTYEALLPNSTALFVANSGDDTVSDYSAFLNGAVTIVGLLPGSHPVFLTSTQTSNMYVLNSGPIKDVCQTGSVSSISTSTGSVTNTGCVGSNPINMVQAAGGGQIFVLNQGDSSVTVLDPTTLAVVKGGTLTSADGLGLNPVYATSSVDGSYIFVVTQGDGVNPGTLDILTPGTPPAVAKKSVPLGVKPTYSYLDPHLNRLYVTNTGDNTVSVFDVHIPSPPQIPPLAPPVVAGMETAHTTTGGASGGIGGG